ncbi:MAG: LacI family DNA-binding transcriptional regulator [Eubacteriales bacterium]|nr:LacI family DNA-binding transcriptional regulator [Eubacteriales bacterium]
MTIKEVAQLAGVSPAAVSRYLNGGSISEEKRARVRRAIEETGYRPNPMAQTMRTGRINQVGVIVPRIHSDSVSRITAGAAQELFKQNYMTVLGCTENSTETELRYLEIMQENQVSGILLMGTILTEEIAQALRTCRVPVVVTGQNFEGLTCVCHDDFHAVRDLTNLLIARGRRRIAMISAPEEDVAAGLNRRRGAEQALLDAGLDVAAMPREISTFDAKGGKAAMSRLLDRCPDLDGVVCATDTIAMGAICALREAGRSIPGDVSIVGVGDSWVDTVSTPALTTARFFYRQCGEVAAKLLLEMIDADAPADHIRQIRLNYRIVERGSV